MSDAGIGWQSQNGGFGKFFQYKQGVVFVHGDLPLATLQIRGNAVAYRHQSVNRDVPEVAGFTGWHGMMIG
tara:strand:- start:731 stop:943 length:213 start_codon:yes stop_codon:yes gene_type:complete